MIQNYRGLDKTFYGSNFKLDEYFKTNTVGTVSEKKLGAITYAGLKLQSCAYEAPKFHIDYSLQIPEMIKSKVNKQWITFIEDC